MVDQIEVVPLNQTHKRSDFNCGVDVLNRWCRKGCLKEQMKHHSRVFVATQSDGSVVGIYSLSIKPLVPTKSLRYHLDQIPAIYFDNLAVTEEFQGQRIGASLMANAFSRTVQISEHVGVKCLWLTAINEQMCKFYERLGFIRTKPRHERDFGMYVPFSAIEDSLKA